MPENTEIELRSEEVQEILTRVPHWMIRWGNVVILALLLFVLALSWIIKYPDLITTQILITTPIPPEKLVAKIPGKIEAILVHDKMLVSKNTPLAVIESSANFKDVFSLSNTLSKGIETVKKFPFENFKNAQLGNIEDAFALFQKEYIANQLNTKLQPYRVEGTAQSYEAIQLKERLSLLESQKNSNQKEMVLQKNDLERYDGLHKKGIIATEELEKHKLNYLQAERNYKNVLSTISQLKSSLNELSKNSKTTQINENKETVNLERNVIHAFYGLKKAIKEWELNYVLRSSIDGKVSFLQLWAPNQNIEAGVPIFSVIPTAQMGYIGKVKATAQNSGKIKVGQTVNIRLANYPDHEFGIIKGIVQNISLTPDKDGSLLINVSLPNGLKTSFSEHAEQNLDKKQIVFQQEMVGTADIITEDLRLIERLLYQFREVFRK